MLGGMDGIRYKKGELTLEKGDAIFLYTDGLSEAHDAKSVLYGEDRIEEKLNASGARSMKELLKYMSDDVDSYMGDVDQFDDITLLGISYLGGSMKGGEEV